LTRSQRTTSNGSKLSSIFSYLVLITSCRGTGLSSPENPDETEAGLNAELERLNRQELQLDENLRTVQADLKRLAEESANSRLALTSLPLFCLPHQQHTNRAPSRPSSFHSYPFLGWHLLRMMICVICLACKGRL
jgi:uncharacterized membrane protein YccC